MKPIQYIPVVTLAVVSIVTFSGCSVTEKIAEKATEKAMEQVAEKTMGEDGKNANIDIENGNINIETEEGSFNITNDETIPKDWPEDVPVDDQLTVIGSTTIEQTYSLSLVDKNDDVEQVYTDYKDVLEENGWKEQAVYKNNGTSIFQAEKDERTVSLTVSASDDTKYPGTSIYLMVASK